MPINKKKKGKGGGSGGSSRRPQQQQQQERFPTGDFEAAEDGGGDGGGERSRSPTRGATSRWHDSIIKRQNLNEMTPDEIIVHCAPSPRLLETADPDVRAHVEAHALFAAGLRCGRHGEALHVECSLPIA
jgi:hypothetical protein